MKKLFKNKWFTLFAALLVVTLSSTYAFQTIKNKSIQKKLEELQLIGEQGFVERTRSEKIRFNNEEALRGMEKAEERERVQKEQMIKDIKKWIQGTWIWSGRMHVYGNQYMYAESKLLIDGDHVVSIANGKVLDQGTITNIDLDKQIIHFGNYSYLEFNNNNQTIYLGSRNEMECFRKISNTTSGIASGPRSSESHFNSNSESYLMNQFNKLNAEGTQLVEEIERYYRSGPGGPWTIQAVFRLKQIQDEKIRLAQQMGDRELEAICRQQKSQTIMALRQMGF